MEFPSADEFPRNTVENISKWRDLPTSKRYVVLDVRQIKTRYGFTDIAELQIESGEHFMSWVPGSVSKRFDEFKTPFFMLNHGLTPCKYDKNKSYYDVLCLPGRPTQLPENQNKFV